MTVIGFMQDGKIYAKLPAEVKFECIGCAFDNDHEGCWKAPPTCGQSDVIYKEVLINEID